MTIYSKLPINIKGVSQVSDINQDVDLYIIHSKDEKPLIVEIRKKKPNSDFIIYSKNIHDIKDLLHLTPIIGVAQTYDELKEIILNVKKNNYITIKQGLGLLKIKIKNIRYVNIENRCMAYHCIHSVELSNTLQDSFQKHIEPLLDNPNFVFLPPSLLINIDYAKKLYKNHVELSNNEIVYFPSSKHYLLEEKFIGKD